MNNSPSSVEKNIWTGFAWIIAGLESYPQRDAALDFLSKLYSSIDIPYPISGFDDNGTLYMQWWSDKNFISATKRKSIISVCIDKNGTTNWHFVHSSDIINDAQDGSSEDIDEVIRILLPEFNYCKHLFKQTMETAD